ncbi:MAG: hypothetical protein ACJ8M4_09815 [Chthoniobacterales bacterium]
MNHIRSIIASLLACLIAVAAAPAPRAATPPDQIKAATAIALTTELLDKMDAFITPLKADDAAKTQLKALPPDPGMGEEKWGSLVDAKAPKVAELFKTAGITADDFGKAMLTLIACGMSEDLGKSDNKVAKANWDFVAANKERADKTFGSFMELVMPADPSSAPAPTP